MCLRLSSCSNKYKILCLIPFYFFSEQGANFIGRDALIEQRKEMLNKKLVCLTLDTDNIDAEGNETIWYEGRVRILLIVLRI